MIYDCLFELVERDLMEPKSSGALGAFLSGRQSVF